MHKTKRSSMSKKAAIRRSCNRQRIAGKTAIPNPDPKTGHGMTCEERKNVHNQSLEYIARSARRRAEAWQRRVAAGMEL